MSEVEVTAILVTYNPDENFFCTVVKSIASQVNNVIVIDNASKNNDVVNNATADIKNAEVYLSDKNVGLASAQNQGIRKAFENGSSHIILFDQDSIIEPFFIHNLLTAEAKLISDGIKLAAIGPSFISPETDTPYPATVYCGPFIKRVVIEDKPIEATFIIASGCLIRKNAIDKIGLMKDELFIDYIDVEWSLRAKTLGYKVFISPAATMVHSIGDRRMTVLGRSISVHSPFRRYFLVRNSFFMLRLHYIPFGYKVRECTFNILRFFIGLCVSDDKKMFFKYTMHAIKDGILGRFGPCRMQNK
ncbi:rhamnosyltransferase [Hafnia paralvei]|uniref:rhamnosyltransferase n=1 Tax=Hafnia paralvei TaxID=546367 RepID=UPI0026DDC1FD|nr:rhamnosyltransferase [Hafnia paralvei]MDX6909985.1 rhamnosyltransferase [Hafnia paralvei]